MCTKHKKLEANLSSNVTSVYDHILEGTEKTNLNKMHTNHLYMLNELTVFTLWFRKTLHYQKTMGI